MTTPKFILLLIVSALTVRAGQVVLTWEPNYGDNTNVETVIESSTVLPPVWVEKFHGRTNTVTLEATNAFEFYRAGNRVF